MNKYLILTNSVLYQLDADNPEQALEDVLPKIKIGIEDFGVHGNNKKRVKRIYTWNKETKRFEL